MLIFNILKVYILSYLQCKSMKIKKKLFKTGGSKRDVSMSSFLFPPPPPWLRNIFTELIRIVENSKKSYVRNVQEGWIICSQMYFNDRVSQKKEGLANAAVFALPHSWCWI